MRNLWLIASRVVVRTRYVDASCCRVRLDIFWPVHGSRAKNRCCRSGPDQHISLVAEAARFIQRPAFVIDKRQPFSRASGIEARHVERAFIQDVAIGLRILGIEPPS